ncbi:MAG: glycosyl transferase family 2 [Bacteroidota bacterium]|nr:glycosyl transferase family 2 [Bacteroidota bacterium]
MGIEMKIFIGCVALQAVYYLAVFSRLNFVRPFKGLPEFLPPVSVIICAKNEAQNLLRNLKIVLIQQYKQFEVIVVNDQSDDNTADVLVDYYMRNKNLKIVNIPKGEKKSLPGKKYALLKGLEAASFDTIVVTDADCRPATTYWLAKMAGAYMHETQIVLGHSPYEKAPGFLNKLIRYENFMTALQYFGFAKSGLPYMGVGRNLSYKKDLIKGFKGFEKSKDVLTGDDDLFINAVANGGNTEVCIDKDAFMYTKPETTLGAWLNQKKRHLRSGFRYKIIHRLLLFLFALSNLAFYVVFVVVLAKGLMLKLALGLFFGLLILKMLSIISVYKKLGQQDLLFISPILDVTYTSYLVIILLLLLLKPKDNWKT